MQKSFMERIQKLLSSKEYVDAIKKEKKLTFKEQNNTKNRELIISKTTTELPSFEVKQIQQAEAPGQGQSQSQGQNNKEQYIKKRRSTVVALSNYNTILDIKERLDNYEKYNKRLEDSVNKGIDVINSDLNKQSENFRRLLKNKKTKKHPKTAKKSRLSAEKAVIMSKHHRKTIGFGIHKSLFLEEDEPKTSQFNILPKNSIDETDFIQRRVDDVIKNHFGIEEEKFKKNKAGISEILEEMVDLIKANIRKKLTSKYDVLFKELQNDNNTKVAKFKEFQDTQIEFELLLGNSTGKCVKIINRRNI